MIPAVVKKRVLKPTKGDIAKLVLPGGGDLTSRVWAGVRLHVKSLTKWCTNRAFNTPAYNDANMVLENFIFLEEGSATQGVFLQAWTISSGLETLQVKCEIMFFV